MMEAVRRSTGEVFHAGHWWVLFLTVFLTVVVWLLRPSTAQAGQVTQVSVSASPRQGTPVTVTVAATPPCGAIEINFDDGTVTTFPVVTLPLVKTHTYARAGAVTIAASGRSGCLGLVKTSVNVLAPLGQSGSGTFQVITRRPDLNPSLAGSLTTASAVQDLPYAVSVRNDGTGVATNVVVRATLPREVNFLNVAQSTLGTCTPSGQPGAQVVTCSGATLAAGATGRVRITARPIVGLADNTRILFSVAVDPANTISESNETNNTAFIVTVLRAVSDLEIASVTVTKQPLTNPPTCSPNTTVRVRVTNNGPAQSAATVLGVTWTSGISLDPCADGSSCVEAACITGARPRTGCFGQCAVPGLFPGTGTDIVFRVHRFSELSVLGTVTLDPLQQINDPNRGNNVRQIQ
jgi:uncharacterized repeat protein (TIGR01451 family)